MQIREALTFDDVLLVPAASSVLPSTLPSKKWLAPSTIWCSMMTPFCVFTFSITGITSRAGATRSSEPCTNRPEEGQGARKVKS